MNNRAQVKLLSLPKIEDDRGNLTFLQENSHIPFKVERVFWTYDVPGGEQRGGHAYKEQEEVIVALSGSFDLVITKDNGECKIFQLNRSYNAIYIPAKTWRHIENHSTNAVSLHLSSHKYDAYDYIRTIKDLK
jgi:oxalate decarboxylase/phosphoglucose isomerase-like protein (cupin superfamily)